MKYWLEITPNELIEKGLWSKFCSKYGYEEYCISEGTLDGNEILYISEDQLEELENEVQKS